MDWIVVPIREEADILIARRAAREVSRELGFGLADQTCLATAVSELARNVVQYAGGGECSIRDASQDQTAKVQVQVLDTGPGISDLELAMTDGYSSGGGLGAGLPGARRLVHRFEIQSGEGGTKILLEMVRER